MDLINLSQLEFLTKLGMQEDTVDILGTKFSFRTLTVDESTQSFEAPAKEKYEDEIAKFNAMRIEVLSKAITKINNLTIPENFRDRLKIMLKKSQQVALNKLFDAYAKLVEKQDQKFQDAEKSVKEQAPPMPPDNIEHLTTQTLETVVKPETQPIMSDAPADEPISIVNPNQLFGKKQ
jgi:hypothetical protein